jgi:hypothetical protein
MDNLLVASLIFFVAAFAILIIIALVRKFGMGKQLNKVMIISMVFLALSVGLARFLYGSIAGSIIEKEEIIRKEARVIEKLKLIREAQIVYLDVYGEYTDDWATLITFIEHGTFYIKKRTEKIIPLDYGADSIVVSIDTIGTVPAKERIFKRNFTIEAAGSGEFLGYLLEPGATEIIKGTKTYRMRTADRGVIEPNAVESGFISNIEDIEPGTEVKRGQILINYWNYRFKPDFEIAKLAEIPYSDGKQFEIYTGTVEKGNSVVKVIEVKDIAPLDPLRKESNETKSRRPLRFGSRTDVTTSGNWE